MHAWDALLLSLDPPVETIWCVIVILDLLIVEIFVQFTRVYAG